MASDALLRVGEVEALDVGDVNLTEQTVLIRRSKTDQEGEGVLQFLGEPTVERIRAWLEAASLTEGALFRPVHRSGRVQAGRLTERSIRRVIIRRARDAACGGPGQRAQPARGQRAEPGHRRGLPRRDAGRRALAVAGHAGALCAGTTRETGSRGETALRLVSPAGMTCPLDAASSREVRPLREEREISAKDE